MLFHSSSHRPPRERGGSLDLDRSTDFEVLCRFLPAIAHDFILNNLPLVEGAEPRALDYVDEYVPAPTLGLDESIALRGVETTSRFL
jgi:hypothetical protein